MIRARYFFTFLAGASFVVTFFYSPLFLRLKDVSGETSSRKNFTLSRDGASMDGTFTLHRVPVAPVVPQRLKVMNHGRTMRAFIAQNGSIPTLYVETFNPPAIFRVDSSFLAREGKAPFWVNEHTAGISLASAGESDAFFWIDLLNRKGIRPDMLEVGDKKPEEMFFDIVIP